MACRLAATGFFGGDPQRALSAPADVFLKTLQYDIFRIEYERAAEDINREE